MNPIAILGAGAIGQLIHRQLFESGIKASLLARSANKNKQLTYTQIGQEQAETYSVDWHQVSTVKSMEEVELLIVCVKAYQVIPALTSLLDKLSSRCHILLLHNGMGPHLTLKKMLNELDKTEIGLSLGTTSQAALKLASAHIKQTGTGLTQLGHFCGPKLNNLIQEKLLRAIPNSQWLDNIITALWQKLAINAAINPLTAIHDCNNGQLAQELYRQDIADRVNELHVVAHAEGIDLDKQGLLERVYSVIELTQANFSSMHQDVHHDRQTEILAINGYVCERGRVQGIDTPKNKQMKDAVLAINYLS